MSACPKKASKRGLSQLKGFNTAIFKTESILILYRKISYCILGQPPLVSVIRRYLWIDALY